MRLDGLVGLHAQQLDGPAVLEHDPALVVADDDAQLEVVEGPLQPGAGHVDVAGGGHLGVDQLLQLGEGLVHAPGLELELLVAQAGVEGRQPADRAPAGEVQDEPAQQDDPDGDRDGDEVGGHRRPTLDSEAPEIRGNPRTTPRRVRAGSAGARRRRRPRARPGPSRG